MSLLAETRCTGLFCYCGGVDEGAFVVVVVVVVAATYVCLSYKGLCYRCFFAAIQLLLLFVSVVVVDDDYVAYIVVDVAVLV